MTFRSKIQIIGVNPYVLVSATRAAKIKKGWRKPLPVRIRVNGHPKTAWRINMMPTGDGSFYLYLHGSVRKASKTKVGDMIDVEIEFDEKYKSGPTHPMPRLFDEAMRQNARAGQTWSELTPSLQKEFLRYFSNLKSLEAQARNIERAIRVLAGHQERFLGRLWNAEAK